VLLSEADGKKLLFQDLKSGKDLIQTPFGNLPTISEKVGSVVGWTPRLFILWVTRGADSHRLATHSNQAKPTGGPRQSLTREIRLTPLSQETPRLLGLFSRGRAWREGGGGGCCRQGLDLMQTPFGNLPTSSTKVGLMQGLVGFILWVAGRGVKVSLDCCLQWLRFIQTPFGSLPASSTRAGSMQGLGSILGGAGRGVKVSLDCCLQWSGFIQTPFGNLPASSTRAGSMQGLGSILGGCRQGLESQFGLLLAVVGLHSDALWQPTHHQRKGGFSGGMDCDSKTVGPVCARACVARGGVGDVNLLLAGVGPYADTLWQPARQ
jgi:hypothetical protein